MEEHLDFTYIDALLLVITENVLPSADVISDVLLINQLITVKQNFTSNACQSYNCIDFNLYGYLMIIPLIVSTLLMLPQWWRYEGSNKSRILTLPLVLLQCWPQSRAVRILWLHYVKKQPYFAHLELKILKGSIGNIGKY